MEKVKSCSDIKYNEGRGQRLLFIDNIRILLTFLVVLHHWAIANGAPGDWYLKENYLSQIEAAVMSLFVATNQAFFMGFFFFISAYFIPGNYSKKGYKIFLQERLIRLGIPLIFYICIISPIILFLVSRIHGNYTKGLFNFLYVQENIFSPGPLWFVQLLLIFNLFYIGYKYLVKRLKVVNRQNNFQYLHLIILFVFLVTATYVIRIYWMVGEWIPFLNFQPAHLVQYIVFFIIGLAAKRNSLVERITYRQAIFLFAFSQVLIVGGFMTMFFISGGIKDIEIFMGGMNGYSLLYTFWEQLIGMMLCISLLGLFYHGANFQSGFLKDLAGNSYAIYIFHSLIVVAISLGFNSFRGISWLKFLILSPVILLFCYLFAKFVRRSKLIKKVI